MASVNRPKDQQRTGLVLHLRSHREMEAQVREVCGLSMSCTDRVWLLNARREGRRRESEPERKARSERNGMMRRRRSQCFLLLTGTLSVQHIHNTHTDLSSLFSSLFQSTALFRRRDLLPQTSQDKAVSILFPLRVWVRESERLSLLTRPDVIVRQRDELRGVSEREERQDDGS